MNPRLKQIIKNKLSKDLSSVSIIDYSGSIWFIGAESKYWYLELYKKTKTLWWRLDFFEDFFTLFSMEQSEFVPIITEWVEEVLNGKVDSIPRCGAASKRRVEEVLNDVIINSTNAVTSVDTVERMRITSNGNIVLTGQVAGVTQKRVEEVLDGKILSTVGNLPPFQSMVEEILKSEAVSTRRQKLRQETQVEKILNTEGVSADSQIFIQEALCHQVLSSMIETTTPDPSDYFRVEDVLPHKEINNTT
jgi:hypothetical protein